MEAQPLDVPILLIIFNRPDVTKRVFDAIRDARPARLFVGADGPRTNRPDDVENCRLARAVITENIDWPCKLETLFRNENLGGRDAVTGAFKWFFESVEEGIVLEDDDLPDPSFFPYCKEMLEKYRDNPRVMSIEGTSVQGKNRTFKNPDSYYFSRIPMGWGWASWRRVWKQYDPNIKKWPALRDSGALKRVFNNSGGYERFSRVFDDYYEGRLPDSYDGQLVFASLANDGVVVVPGRNLISNIGFGASASHTKDPNNEWANLPTYPMQFPLQHPKTLNVNQGADDFLYRYYFHVDKKLRYRLVRPFKDAFPRTYQTIKRFLGRDTPSLNLL